MTTTTKLTARRYLVLLVEPDCIFRPIGPDDWPEAFHVLPFDYQDPDATQTLADAMAQAARLNSGNCLARELKLWAITVADWDNTNPRLPGYCRFSAPGYEVAFARKGGAA